MITFTLGALAIGVLLFIALSVMIALFGDNSEDPTPKPRRRR